VAASLFVRKHGRWPESERLLPHRLGRLLAQGRDVTGKIGRDKAGRKPWQGCQLEMAGSSRGHGSGVNREGPGNRQDENYEHFEGRTEKSRRPADSRAAAPAKDGKPALKIFLCTYPSCTKSILPLN